jgi:DNA-binding MarR family transcriptional regulator
MNIFRELGIREGADRVNEEVLYNVVRASTRLLAHFDAFLEARGVSVAQFNTLLMIRHVGRREGIAQNALSELLLVSTSNMTRMIDRLEKEGWAERLPRPGDRRVKLVRATQKGTRLLDAIWPRFKEEVDARIGPLFSKAEKAALVRSLEKFRRLDALRSSVL